MKQETAARAATWWADFLKKGAPLDHGDPSEQGGMAMMLGKMLQMSEAEDRAPDAADAFEAALTGILKEQGREYLCLGVDYHPDHLLRQAAEQAGVDLGMASLPWKTQMWITGEVIKVSEGYRAETVTLEA